MMSNWSPMRRYLREVGLAEHKAMVDVVRGGVEWGNETIPKTHLVFPIFPVKPHPFIFYKAK